MKPIQRAIPVALATMVLALLNGLTCPAATLLVWQGSPGPTPPYATWATAATNIQDAIDAASAGDEVVVTTASAACLAAAETTQTSAKSGFDIAQEDVGDQRPTVDPVIKDLWDTIEYNVRADAPPSLRRKAREWGVAYDGEEEAPAPPAPPTP